VAKGTLKVKSNLLSSWKEIATFLGRGVRTVQRWERELGLPVHRVRNTEHSPVFAYREELQVWLKSKPALAPQNPAIPRGRRQLRYADIHAIAEQTVRRSQDLVQALGSLVMEQTPRAEALVENLRVAMTRLNERRQRRPNYDSEPKQINIS
jgi:phage terminase Nu1 subunit (DNA packaging protein)